MSNRSMAIGGDIVDSPGSTHALLSTAMLVQQGTAGETKVVNFINGEINYFGTIITQSFWNVLIDNIGDGSVRIAFNNISLDISTYTNGAKTLKSGDNLSLSGAVRTINIYFIQTSVVEIVLQGQ